MDFLLQGHFTPWTVCPMEGHFASQMFRPMDVSPHRRFTSETIRPTDDVNINNQQRPGFLMSASCGTEVAHVTRDSDTTFKVKRSRSPGRFAHRRVGASGGCSAFMGVRTCWPWETAATLPSAQPRDASAPTEGRGEGRVHIVAGCSPTACLY